MSFKKIEKSDELCVGDEILLFYKNEKKDANNLENPFAQYGKITNIFEESLEIETFTKEYINKERFESPNYVEGTILYLRAIRNPREQKPAIKTFNLGKPIESCWELYLIH